MKKGLVYYTDNTSDPYLLGVCRSNLKRCAGEHDIVSVSSIPTDLGRNFIIDDIPRGPLQIFKKILFGLQQVDADIIYLIENDILYHPSHFDFIPPKKDIFYYNRNRYAVDPVSSSKTYGLGVFYETNVLSLLVAHKDLMLRHWVRRVELTEKHGFKSSLGYSPPKGIPAKERAKYVTWKAELPCLDIRHEGTYTRKRMHKSQFSSPNSRQGWNETYDIPFWGKLTPWNDFLRRVNNGSIYEEKS